MLCSGCCLYVAESIVLDDRDYNDIDTFVDVPLATGEDDDNDDDDDDDVVVSTTVTATTTTNDDAAGDVTASIGDLQHFLIY